MYNVLPGDKLASSGSDPPLHPALAPLLPLVSSLPRAGARRLRIPEGVGL